MRRRWKRVICRLEGEPCSKLTGERPRQRGAGGIDEPNRFAKRRIAFRRILHRVVEVVAIIGMVEEVKSLESKLQVAVLAQFDVLGETCIPIEVWVAPHRI